MIDSKLSRRNLLKMGLGATVLSATACSGDYRSPDNWYQGDLQHLIPLVSHRSFNIKLSFLSARDRAPILKVGNRSISGRQQDTLGRFWAFRVGDLSPDTEYQLQLHDPSGTSLCDPWPLKTFPDPAQKAERLRVISYTCAGGPDLPVLPGNRHAFKPVVYRQKLFDTIVGQKPDMVISNGDHIYWDYRSWVKNPDSAMARMAIDLFLGSYGSFDESLPVKGTKNEITLQAIADEQIGKAYGVRFRSTPVYFVTDDHDYFDNDDATPELVTFPPNNFHQDLRDTLQAQYFPEYIVEEELPTAFPGYTTEETIALSTHFGAARFGDLFCGALYDCGGKLNLAGDDAGLIPQTVEDWLLEKTALEDTRHLIHIPSHPMGWTAGKWREWYPDLIESEDTLLAEVKGDGQGNKFMWQRGWWSQHQRLIEALSLQKERKPLIVSGDLHLLGAGQIKRSGSLDLASNPVTSILSGPVGVGGLGWLSKARGLSAKIPKSLVAEALLTPRERNGYTLIDMSRTQCRIELYQCPEGYVMPKDLKPSLLKAFNV
ncbi:hypothetical protein [Microbulbifer taiwanensis]|uniref:Phosphodiesterase n=1 Tax=Microbulbifer taiwanensis TaxID=986746 RepID=A0ABW1YK88_9GAMM|nr:hypothetical protein [Microbulbifer taiwanensis]